MEGSFGQNIDFLASQKQKKENHFTLRVYLGIIYLIIGFIVYFYH
ncbi:MAG: hypothetical protein Q8911_02035 [Bacillota bacterium]|nr:hypothetical protein [Bacillota bacterium]